MVCFDSQYNSGRYNSPNCYLISPANGTIRGTGDVVFEYVANDVDSGIDFCSLIIDGVIDQANLTVTEGTVQSFAKTGMPAGTYAWSVNCTDDSTNANVGASETNSLQISTAPPTDTLPPSVSSVQPPPGQDLAPNANITISAIVMDNVAVDTVYAFVILPDYTTAQVPLASMGSALYSAVFTDTNLSGRYDIIIVANDTSGNVNNAVTTWFNVSSSMGFEEDVNDQNGNPLNVTVLIIDINTGEIVYNSTEDHHNTTVSPGTYHVVIIPPGDYSSITNITFWYVNITTSINQLVDLSNIFDIRYLDPNVIYNNVFAANLVLTAPYSYSTLYFVASAPSLYKCRVFDFEDQICYGQWIKVLDDLVVGQVYSINLTRGDPAFGEGTDKLVLTTITVNGNMTDWAAVLDNSNNIITDGVSGIDDPDNPTTVSRDLTKFAFTWDSNNFYTYFRRVYGTPSAVTLLVYLDYGQDGYMNSSDKVLRIVWRGGSKKYSMYLHNYVPSNVSGDILTGDGVDMPGSLSNQTTLAIDVPGVATNNIELEANVSWANLGLAAGAPFKFHISLAKGDTTSVPADVEDNIARGSILLADVLITPDNTGGTNANTSVYYNHTVKNLGNYNDTFNINLSSSKGFTVQALWPNGTALTDTNNDSLVDIGKLAPSANTSITVKVTVPAGTAAGTKDITRVSAISAQNSNISSIAYDTTFVGDITVTPAYFGRIANNTILTYNHTVANNLGVNVVIDLNATSNQGWTVQLTWPNGTALTDTNANGKIDVGNVSSGSSKNFSLKLTVPSAAAVETMDTTTITANSSVNASNSGFVTDRTTVAPRIEVSPDHAGEAGVGDYIFYEHEVFNNWNSSDVINMAYSSNKSWPGTLFKSDKTILLNDTNSDGKPDTGILAYAGGSVKIVAKVSVPTSVVEGDMDVARVNGTSSLNSTISGKAIDNTTARILINYNDSARTQQDDYFRLNETVYAKAFGLNGIAEVYFVWVDSNDTIKRTSPDITVDASKQALDNFTTNSSMPAGNWTVILYKSSNHQEITRRDFFVAEITPPNVTNVLPSAGTSYNQSSIVTIRANVTDNVAVDTVLASITLPNSTVEQIILSNIVNSSGYIGNFTNTNLTGRYNITIFANDTSGNANTGTSWFNITISCTQNLTNTSWSAWANLSCVGSQMNQSRFLTQYDTNNCGYVNQTFYEYQLVGPTYANTTWGGWYNITGCLPANYYTQERNLTQYDTYGCAANTTFYGYQNLTCDYCTPNSTNTTWSGWSNVSCSGNQMNQSRYLTQYDSNNCNETTNQTFYSYQLVGPTYQNTSWTSWYNITACLLGDYYTQERNLTQFDTYGCAANQTFYGYQNQTCDFCTPNLTNTTWSSWINLTCVGDNMNQSQNRTQYDSNNCNETTNQTFYNYQLAGPNWVNGSWSGWYNITACLYGDYYTQSQNMTQTDTYGCAANQTVFEYQNQTCDFCTPSLANTSWSAWANGTCSGSQMNQSRFRTQYDVNNCNETTNQTFYEYLLVGPTYANTSWSSWYNITACLPGDYYTQEKNLTQYDVYGCAANTTFFEHQNQSCVYCASNLTNTTWSDWVNLTCIGNQMNQSKNLTQYDTNNCTANQTFFEYQLVGPDWINGTWTGWYNVTTCLLGDYYTQERNLTQHDTYGCAANQTFFGYQNLTCDYCTPNLTNTTWTGWYNTSACYANNTIDQARNKTQYDTNNCNETTNQTFFEYGTAACDYDGAPRIEIISPINSTYTTGLLLVNISVNDSAISRIWYNWNGTNVTYTTPVNVTFNEGSNTLIVYVNDTIGNLNSTSVSFTVDTTPPHAITNLQSLSQSVTWIYWTWTKPIDADFYQNIIYVGGINVANTSSNYYNATGLTQNSTYTITINTKDLTGNVNTTNVSNTNKTLVDNTPPVISNVTVQSVTHNSAQIVWTTDELANSTIEYGTTLAFGSNASNASFVLTHTIPLAGLSASTMYFFNVTSCDQYNYCITDGPYNFTTSATPIIPPGPGGGGGGGGGMGGGNITNATNVTTATTNATPGTSLGFGRYYIGNFLYAHMYNYTQSLNEVWVFTYEFVDHTVTLLRINDGQSVDLMVNSTAIYFNLLVGQNRVIDVDGDSVGDVRITLNAITAGRANITVELLNKPAGAGSAGFSLPSWWIFLVVLFLIWAIWRKKKRDEERKKEAAEKREAKGKRVARRKSR